VPERPKTRALADGCFKFRAPKSGSSPSNVMESSARRQRPRSLYSKFLSGIIPYGMAALLSLPNYRFLGISKVLLFSLNYKFDLA
jgi:hypothetical protein